MKKKKRAYKIQNTREKQIADAKEDLKIAFNKDKYIWLALLCGLYFLKYINPVFAWFGALGALGFYRNSNKTLRKLTYLSVFAILGLLGFIL